MEKLTIDEIQAERLRKIRFGYANFLRNKEAWDSHLNEINEITNNFDYLAINRLREQINVESNYWFCLENGVFESGGEREGRLPSLSNLTELIIKALD